MDRKETKAQHQSRIKTVQHTSLTVHLLYQNASQVSTRCPDVVYIYPCTVVKSILSDVLYNIQLFHTDCHCQGQHVLCYFCEIRINIVFSLIFPITINGNFVCITYNLFRLDLVLKR